MAIDTLTFQVPEILSLVGLVQCVYILVYMAFRAGSVRFALLPGAYFLVLATAFFIDFAQRFIGGDLPSYPVWQWAAWFSGPALSVLLAIQVARVTRLPRAADFMILLLPVAGFAAAHLMVAGGDGLLQEWLTIFGIVAGGAAMLTLWLRRGLWDDLRRDGQGTRYWLVLTLVLMNGAFLGTMLVSLGPWLTMAQAGMIRTITGLGLVYLSGTALFRIYPQSLNMAGRGRAPEALDEAQTALARRIESLLDLDKVYQEPTYSRSDLARELNVAETVVSRIINVHFGKSFPQLLNERRIDDARRLLAETDAPVKQVAEEVGFNSMATFNRVFREATGRTPTEYRQNAGHQPA